MFSMLMPGINVKSFLKTSIIMFIYIYATDFLIHGVWLSSAYMDTQSLWRTQDDMIQHMPWMLFGQFTVALFFTGLFVGGYKHGGMMEGVRFGILIGMFTTGGMFIQHAVTPIPFDIIMSWIGGAIIQTVFGGILASIIYKK